MTDQELDRAAEGIATERASGHRVDLRLAGRELERVLAEFGEPLGPEIRQRAAFVDAMTAGQGVGAYDPKSSAHQDVKPSDRHSFSPILNGAQLCRNPNENN